jgi:electron transfer flavoprotein beta subunit
VDTLVCVKAIVPERPRLRDEGDGPVFEKASRLILNESDGYAVDEAVLLRKRHGGRVTAVTVGSLSTQDALYSALAKGADEALRVDDEGGDPLLVARLLAAVAREGRYDLILTGIESWEDLASAVGPALAATLDLPFASAVSGIDVAKGEGSVVVSKELGGGLFQTLEMPLPAVLSVQSGICRLSYPPTVRVLQARKRPPRSASPESLGVALSPQATSLVTITAPRREREAEILAGSPGEVARALLDRIQEASAPS